ncbi:transcriptional regulator, TetR family [Ligilactobacillus sp. WC1T17]|uniref:Transcriptional regulator, TetR family n=1 Tax=Ligilactobacillus ruminis TaxID=1623 RepID=A0ABY1ACL0_9LACO|nr:transcriptional regulator, TetR family [Ligilactobacillus ruminis]
MNKSVRKIIDSYLSLVNQYGKVDVPILAITKNADISRATFYNHFNNVEEVVVLIEQDIDKQINQTIQKYRQDYVDQPYLMLAQKVLPILYEKRDILKILYTSPLRAHWLNFLRQKYDGWVSSFFKTNKDNKIPKYYSKNMSYFFYFSIVELWLAKPIPEDPQTFEKIFLQMVSTPIINLI